jgi:hypothetical protein
VAWLKARTELSVSAGSSGTVTVNGQKSISAGDGAEIELPLLEQPVFLTNQCRILRKPLSKRRVNRSAFDISVTDTV